MFFEKQQIDKPYKNIFKEMYYETKPQSNYHGSPYIFNKFDDSKFLTGEGFAAHGPGHYSADLLETAKQYPYDTAFSKGQWVRLGDIDIPPIWNEMDKGSQFFYVRDKIKEYKKLLKDPSYTDSLKSVWRDVLEGLEDFKNTGMKTNIGTVYKVNTPNEYFLWKEGVPMEGQSDYVQKAMKNKSYIDYSKYIPDNAMNYRRILYKFDLNEEPQLRKMADLLKQLDSYTPSRFNDKHKDLYVRMLNKLPIDKQFRLLDYFRGNADKPNMTPEMFKLFRKDFGVKGIRAIGHMDGPINVTFSQDNIKMANTPWQRFRNRIPLNSLGTLANKIISSPWFRAANEYVVPASVGLDYLKPLDIIMSKGKDKQQKLQKMFEDTGYEVEIQPDGTYLFKGGI